VKRAAFTALSGAATALALAFLALPVLAIFLRVSPGDLLARLDDRVVRTRDPTLPRTRARGHAL
jgi:hypothetical protein